METVKRKLKVDNRGKLVILSCIFGKLVNHELHERPNVSKLDQFGLAREFCPSFAYTISSEVHHVLQIYELRKKPNS